MVRLSRIRLVTPKLRKNSVTPRIPFHWKSSQIPGASAGSQETFGLFGRLGSATSQPVLEIPRTYTLSEALQAALQMNFGTRIEYEHAIQARLSAKSAYLMLLPHLSSGSVLQAIGGGTIGIIQGLGDFAPFLFPSRWFQADQAAKRSLAEDDTLALMRAVSCLKECRRSCLCEPPRRGIHGLLSTADCRCDGELSLPF